MKYPRFRVATCEGYAITDAGSGGHRAPGLSATVCDTLHLWREVRTYRSEDRIPTGLEHGGGKTLGTDGALSAAEDHAAYLNEVHRRELHTEAVRAGREGRRDNGLVG